MQERNKERHEISLCSVCHCFFLETRLTRLPCNFNSVSLYSIHLLLSLSLVLSKRLPYTLVSRVSEQTESTACFCIRNSSQKRNRVVSPLAKFATTASSIETRTSGKISSPVLLSFSCFPLIFFSSNESLSYYFPVSFLFITLKQIICRYNSRCHMRLKYRKIIPYLFLYLLPRVSFPGREIGSPTVINIMTITFHTDNLA